MKINVPVLVQWLGPDGAIAGLEASPLTVADLIQLASEANIPVDRKMTRSEIIIEVVNYKVRRVNISPEQMMSMTPKELHQYFRERRPSRSELIGILSELGVRPSSHSGRNLMSFAAREIAELGVYERVARGRHDP